MFVPCYPILWVRSILLLEALFLFWSAQHAQCVWLCPNGSKLQVRSQSRVCLERSTVLNATEEERLGRVEMLDPMAEYKYRVRCQELDSIEAESAPLHARAPYDLIQCEANEESPRLPGLDEFQWGYNIVTDSAGHGHSPILDVRSTSEFSATMRGVEDDICYRIPDAFVSAQDMGVRFDMPFSADFDIISAISLPEFQIALAKSRKDELGLRDSHGDLPNPGIAIGATFAGSEMLDEIKRLVNWGHGGWLTEYADFVQLSHVESMYAVHVQTAIPTSVIIQEWKTLFYGRAAKEDYDKYFKEFGTHYYVSGQLGGQLRVVFTVKASEEGTKEKLAECVAGTVGDRFFGGKREGTYCPHVWDNGWSKGVKPLEDMLYKFHFDCVGGEKPLCPPDFHAKEKFEQWTESIDSNPAILFGRKKWIPQLLTHVLVRATVEGLEGERFREIIANFASGNNAGANPPSTDDLIENSKQMEAFRDALRLHLDSYLKDHDFCVMDPKNC